MDLDETFRTLMVVGFFALFRIGLYYRLKSQRPRERLDRRHKGVFILATLRPLGPIYWAGMIAYMINPASMAFDSAAVLAVATSMMMANWFVLLAGMLVFLLLAVRSRTEEDMLLARSGESDRTYRSRTGRLLPRLTGEGATR